MSSERDKTGQSTRAVHAGERGPRPRVGDSITVPIVQSATYWFRDTQEVIAYQEGRHASFEYGRYGNPTTRALEEKLAIVADDIGRRREGRHHRDRHAGG